jgi:alkanesulfonate monooxygenase SsuD/methylene tetrahydromethanopterin reductase-like flavin-dependent oxidoreductase (luciferase family)
MAPHRPKFGIYVNNRAAVFLGEAYALDRLLGAAALAEELGFDFVSVGDSILAKPRYAPIPLLSAIAARTQRIKLVTGILQPHLRNPVLLAQEWATLDMISGGRTILGVGLGTGAREMVDREYELVGVPRARRARAFEEAIELLRRLWTEERVTFEGTIFRLRDVSLGYRPAQIPHPPIIVACGGYVPTRPGVGPNDFFTERTAGAFHGPFDRVARLGDGWITGIVTPEEYGRTLTLIRTLAREQYGRALGPEFPAVLNCFIHVGPDAEAARREAVIMLQTYHRLPFDHETIERWTIYGPPARCAERLAAYAAAGANAFQFVPAARDQLTQIRRIAAEVLPLLAGRNQEANESAGGPRQGVGSPRETHDRIATPGSASGR